MAHRPLRDFYPDEQLRMMAHTTRRYARRSALAISPDARAVAYVSDRDRTFHAWSVPAAGGERAPALAVDGAAVHSLCWSASGDLVAAVDRGGTERFQIHVARPDERIEPLATSEGDRVQHLMSHDAASPDGTTLALSSNAREPGDVDIVLVDLASGAQRPLVTGPHWHVAGGWSPDGRRLAVMRVADNLEQTVLVADAGTGEVREATPHAEEAQYVPAGWLADGRLLVITDDVGGPRHLDLVAVDPDSGERTRFASHHGADVELAVVSADGRAAVWSENAAGWSTLHWRTPAGEGSRALDGECSDLAVSRDGSLAAFVRLAPTEPYQVWALDLASGDARPLVTTRTAVPPGELAWPEEVRIPAPDGRIHAFVYRPRGASGRVPAVLYPHGGPEAQSRPGLDHTLSLLQCLVHRGIAVVVPNIHGSTGYGRAWQQAIHRDWGGIDLRDLRAVSDWMAAEPGFDPDRLAVFGGSYGGFAALTCVTRIPERWRAAVDVFGVANLVTMIETNQPNWQRFLRRWIGDLATDRERLLERSPVTHIDAVRCPMLVIQGANDPRVPKGESDQVVERLRARGQRVDYLVFDDEGHGFNRRANRERAYTTIADWLTRELLGEDA